MLNNNYYDIAFNKLGYLQHSINTDYFNIMLVQCQEISEKALKSVAELCVDDKEILRSSNLIRINSAIHNKGTNLDLDLDLDLDDYSFVFLKYFSINASNPGDNFIVVKEYEFIRALKIMYKILNSVNKFRIEKGLPVLDINEKYPNSYNNSLLD